MEIKIYLNRKLAQGHKKDLTYDELTGLSCLVNGVLTTATSFDVQYKAIADQTYESATVNAMEYVVTGLKPSTTYIWMVRANCVPNNPSAWSNGTIFRTADVPVVPERDTTGVADYVKSLVKVYSNMNNVYIVNENDVQINDVQVYDIYGKLIYAGKNNVRGLSLNISEEVTYDWKINEKTTFYAKGGDLLVELINDRTMNIIFYSKIFNNYFAI